MFLLINSDSSIYLFEPGPEPVIYSFALRLLMISKILSRPDKSDLLIYEIKNLNYHIVEVIMILNHYSILQNMVLVDKNF